MGGVTERDEDRMVIVMTLANGRRMVVDDPMGFVVGDVRPEGASGGTATDVYQYMRERTFAHRDARTGKVCATGLAEDTADAFDLWKGDEADIPSWVFELAAEAAFEGEADERARRAG